jgi:hypothetical protein
MTNFAKSFSTRLPIWQIFGGAVFCATIGAIGQFLIYFDILFGLEGLLVGGVVGAYIAGSFGEIQANLIQLVISTRNTRSIRNEGAAGFCRGIRLTQFVCLFLVIPFLVFGSVAVCSTLSIAAWVLNGAGAGAETFRSLAQAAFWLSGLYLHVVLVLAFVYWCAHQGVKLLGSEKVSGTNGT